MKSLGSHPFLVSHHASSKSNAGLATFLARAVEIPVQAGAERTDVPDWVQIFPKGPELATNDGRKFRMSDPDAFVAAHNAAGQPIMVDYDHLSAFDVDEGGEQVAAGWIDELEVRDGEVWAKVAWTVRARDHIASREYRFVSPEFMAHKKTGEIASLDALALVNRPAFQMKALAKRQAAQNGDPTMLKEIAKALGLPEDADEATILAKIAEKETELTSAKAAKVTPSTTDFMPRADYDVVLARATQAEKALEDQELASRKVEVEDMVATAAKEGRIAPSSKDHFINLAMKDDESFEEVKALCKTMPKTVAPSDLDDKETDATGLSEEDKAMCATLGVSEEDYAKQLAADKG